MSTAGLARYHEERRRLKIEVFQANKSLKRCLDYLNSIGDITDEERLPTPELHAVRDRMQSLLDTREEALRHAAEINYDVEGVLARLGNRNVSGGGRTRRPRKAVRA